jgi:hypothetical protein
MIAHQESYLAEFPESPIEYLDTFRATVQTEDPTVVADVQSDFDEYFTMTNPVFMQVILVLFKNWYDKRTGNAPMDTMRNEKDCMRVWSFLFQKTNGNARIRSSPLVPGSDLLPEPVRLPESS